MNIDMHCKIPCISVWGWRFCVSKKIFRLRRIPFQSVYRSVTQPSRRNRLGKPKFHPHGWRDFLSNHGVEARLSTKSIFVTNYHLEPTFHVGATHRITDSEPTSIASHAPRFLSCECRLSVSPLDFKFCLLVRVFLFHYYEETKLAWK